MTAPPAADLPVGSVVALRTHAWVKFEVDGWFATGDEAEFSNDDVQHALTWSAQVLRVGDGSGQ